MSEQESTAYVSRMTDQGLALMAKQELAKLEGKTLPEARVTRVVAGRGYVEPETIAAQTEVSDPIAEMQLGPCRIIPGDDHVVQMRARLASSALEKTERIRQLGVYADDPDEGEILYQLLQYDWELPQPLFSTAANYGAESFFECELVVAFGDGAVFFIPQDPGWTLDEDDLAEHNRDPEAHKPTHPLATIRHGRGRYPLCELTRTEHAAGVTPAGTGPAGGTAPRSIPFQVEYPSRNEIRLLVTDDLAGEVTVNQLDADRYALLYPEGAESLMLILAG